MAAGEITSKTKIFPIIDFDQEYEDMREFCEESTDYILVSVDKPAAKDE